MTKGGYISENSSCKHKIVSHSRMTPYNFYGPLAFSLIFNCDYFTLSDSPLVLVDELTDLTVLLFNTRAFLKDLLFQTFIFLKSKKKKVTKKSLHKSHSPEKCNKKTIFMLYYELKTQESSKNIKCSII